jgi:hypothetical protein
LAANAAVLGAFAWAFPRVDSENSGPWLQTGVMCAALGAFWAVHEQRLLGRPRGAQAMAGLRFVGSCMTWALLLIAASLLIGPAEGAAPVHRLFAGMEVPVALEPIALPMLLVALVAFALIGYRRDKRREAELRQQRSAERAAVASQEANAG